MPKAAHARQAAAPEAATRAGGRVACAMASVPTGFDLVTSSASMSMWMDQTRGAD